MLAKILNVWGPGQILAFSGMDGRTDFNNSLVLRTSFDHIGFDIKLPENGGAIKINNFDPSDSNITLAGDHFKLGETSGAFADSWNLLLEGDIQIIPGESVKILCANNRILVGAKDFFRPELLTRRVDEVMAERHNQLKKLQIPENLPEETMRTLWKAYSQLRTQLCSAEGNIKKIWSTPDRWPHRSMWLWDSVFHAAGMRHLDVAVAREIISAMLECAGENGFIPHVANPLTVSGITQPPLLALGVKLVQDVQPDNNWLRECYPLLKGYIEWDLANRDSDGSGLVEWFIEENETCRSGESGMDNSPRFDCASQLEATDFNAFLSLECEILAEFAAELGISEDVPLWEERHNRLNELINRRLWNDDKGFYFDRNVKTGEMSTVMASSGFLPLICGAPSEKQVAKLVDHLENPETFKTAFPVPSIARCSSEYYSKDMWRGPVWININWLIAEGLRRYGFNREADDLTDKTMNELEKMYIKYGTFFEFYDDQGEVDPPGLLRKRKNIPDTFHQAFHDFGWSATLYIDFVFNRYYHSC